ncbi:MAG: hypothetical protein QME66_13870 [Candidatus Eisenbacteria bacterium]|nr:hypothetical protein [Candidatus Eisenbacteria bacterium]
MLRSIMVFVASCLALIGCRYIGGGVAGASFDPIWQVKAAKRYPAMVSSNKVTVSVARLTGEQPPQLFDDIMHAFPVRQDRVEDSFMPIAGTGLEARYHKCHLDIRSGHAVLINEKLPKVFNMHPVRLGMGTVASQSLIMIVNKSRASTGLYFVALYTAQGVPLYRGVLGAGQVWDIRTTDNGVDILGHSEIRRITMTATEALGSDRNGA